jgi:hypothetical protein
MSSEHERQKEQELGLSKVICQNTPSHQLYFVKEAFGGVDGI